MSPRIRHIQLLVLGERDEPFSPMIRIQGDIAETLGAIQTEAARRLPDVTYEDVVRAAFRIGFTTLQQIFDVDGRVEHGGHLSFAPSPSGQEGRKLDARRAQLLRGAFLDQGRLMVSSRPPVTPPQPQGPKDTLSHATAGTT